MEAPDNASVATAELSAGSPSPVETVEIVGRRLRRKKTADSDSSFAEIDKVLEDVEDSMKDPAFLVASGKPLPATAVYTADAEGVSSPVAPPSSPVIRCSLESIGTIDLTACDNNFSSGSAVASTTTTTPSSKGKSFVDFSKPYHVVTRSRSACSNNNTTTIIDENSSPKKRSLGLTAHESRSTVVATTPGGAGGLRQRTNNWTITDDDPELITTPADDRRTTTTRPSRRVKFDLEEEDSLDGFLSVDCASQTSVLPVGKQEEEDDEEQEEEDEEEMIVEDDLPSDFEDDSLMPTYSLSKFVSTGLQQDKIEDDYRRLARSNPDPAAVEKSLATLQHLSERRLQQQQQGSSTPDAAAGFGLAQPVVWGASPSTTTSCYTVASNNPIFDNNASLNNNNNNNNGKRQSLSSSGETVIWHDTDNRPITAADYSAFRPASSPVAPTTLGSRPEDLVTSLSFRLPVEIFSTAANVTTVPSGSTASAAASKVTDKDDDEYLDTTEDTMLMREFVEALESRDKWWQSPRPYYRKIRNILLSITFGHATQRAHNQRLLQLAILNRFFFREKTSLPSDGDACDGCRLTGKHKWLSYIFWILDENGNLVDPVLRMGNVCGEKAKSLCTLVTLLNSMPYVDRRLSHCVKNLYNLLDQASTHLQMVNQNSYAPPEQEEYDADFCY